MKYTFAGVPQAAMKHHSVPHVNINTKDTNKSKNKNRLIFLGAPKLVLKHQIAAHTNTAWKEIN